MKKYLEKIKNSKFLSRWAVILELLLLQLFALPMLWLSPRFNLFWKIMLTLITVAVTVLAAKYTADMTGVLLKQLKDIQQGSVL